MSALFLVRTDDPAFATQAEDVARRQWARHGLAPPTEIDLPGWRMLHAGPIHGGPETLLTNGDDLVAVAGTPVVDGLIGREALLRLRDAAALPGPDWPRITGHFVAVVRSGGRTLLFADYHAIFQMFHDTEERVFSTSMLAVLGVLPRVRFDSQGLYEWAFGVVTTGNDTIFAELKMLGPERVVELIPYGAVSHPLDKPLTPPETEALPIEEMIARNMAHLMRVAETRVRHFGDAIQCPLSAGMDSRLMLGALRAAGARPSVYVYGPPSGEDVRIARAIGAAEGFHVEWTDKQAPPIAPDDFVDQVERNFHDWDGLPNFGNLFDNGMNAKACKARHAGGALAVSGGGGEVYRDFFMLPDKPMSAMTLARCFNSRFIASDATDLFEPKRYVERIADKIADAMQAGSRDAPISRQRIEQAFPRVRVRALFRWEVNSEARHGPYTMFFLDHLLIAEAMKLPTRLKQAGRFQAMMINAVDPALARHMSGYGHDFTGAPGWRYRLEEAATRYRPIPLREHAYAIHRKRGKVEDEHGGLLSPDYMGRVIDLDFPIMRRFFHVDRIADSGLWRRIACLEHLGAWLGGRLVA
jgi:asparagine synthase (glutamine-hydrolysing)